MSSIFTFPLQQLRSFTQLEVRLSNAEEPNRPFSPLSVHSSIHQLRHRILEHTSHCSARVHYNPSWLEELLTIAYTVLLSQWVGARLFPLTLTDIPPLLSSQCNPMPVNVIWVLFPGRLVDIAMELREQLYALPADNEGESASLRGLKDNLGSCLSKCCPRYLPWVLNNDKNLDQSVVHNTMICP